MLFSTLLDLELSRRIVKIFMVTVHLKYHKTKGKIMKPLYNGTNSDRKSKNKKMGQPP